MKKVRSLPATATAPYAVSDRHVRPDRDCRATRQATPPTATTEWRVGAAGLSRRTLPHALREHLSGWHPRAGCAVLSRPCSAARWAGTVAGCGAVDRLGAWRVRWPTAVVRLILDGTVVRVRLDRGDFHLAARRYRCARDGQGIARVQSWAASAEAWRAVLVSHRAVCDGPSSSSSTARQAWALPPSGTACRCRGAQYTARTARLAPERAREIGADYNDMIYAATPEEIGAPRLHPHGGSAPRRRRQLRGRATGSYIPVCPPRSARTHAQRCTDRGSLTVLPSADTAAMLFSLLAPNPHHLTSLLLPSFLIPPPFTAPPLSGRWESVLYSGGRSWRSAKNYRCQLLQTLSRLAVSCAAPAGQCSFGDTPS